MSARKSSHGTIFLIVSSGSPLALIASSLRSISKKPFCPMTRSLHRPYPRAVTESDSRALGERNFSWRPGAYPAGWGGRTRTVLSLEPSWREPHSLLRERPDLLPPHDPSALTRSARPLARSL